MNNQLSEIITGSVGGLIKSKIDKYKESERIEFGQDADKVSDEVFSKIVALEIQESDNSIKECVRRLYKRNTPERFKEIISEVGTYTDEDFIKDIAEIFGENDSLFIQKELSRWQQ